MGLTTNYLICYDITEDDIRFAVAERCKEAGLVRIQYSVFFGQLEKSQLATLKDQLESTISDANADIHIIKVCNACEKDHRVLSSVNLDSVVVQADELYEDISDELHEDEVLIL